MAEYTLTIEDESILPALRRALNAFPGVKLVGRRSKSALYGKKFERNLQEALNDVKEGRVYKAEDADDLVKQILGDEV